MIMLLMPVCHSYLSLTVSSAWRAQIDNKCGKAPAQRDRPLRNPAPDCHQRAFLHVRYASHLELVANPWLRVASTGCVEIRVRRPGRRARICRIAGVVPSYTYAPGCMSLTVAAIINSTLSFVWGHADRRFRMRSVAGRCLRDSVQIARFWTPARRPRKGPPGSRTRPELAGAFLPRVVIRCGWPALSVSQLARRSWKVRRYAWGLVCTARLKCFRRLAAVEKPLFSATDPIGRSLISRSRWASWTRWRTSHR